MPENANQQDVEQCAENLRDDLYARTQDGTLAHWHGALSGLHLDIAVALQDFAASPSGDEQAYGASVRDSKNASQAVSQLSGSNPASLQAVQASVGRASASLRAATA